MYERETPTQVLANYDLLIKKIARQEWVDTPRCSYEDMVSEGRLAALKAMHGWDEDKRNDNKFSTYLTKYVSGHLKRFKKENLFDLKVSEHEILKNLTPKKENDEAATLYRESGMLALRMDWEVGNDDGEPTMREAIPSGELPPDLMMEREEEIAVLMEEINSLPDKERRVIYAKWFEGKKLDDIAKEGIGGNKSTIHNIAKRALSKLSTRVKARLK